MVDVLTVVPALLTHIIILTIGTEAMLKYGHGDNLVFVVNLVKNLRIFKLNKMLEAFD